MINKALYFVCALCLAFFGTRLAAACTGTDIRASLPETIQTEVATRLAQTPYAMGNHWRAMKGDKTVHLIGTIHFDDPRLDAITERLSGIIAASGLLLVEATGEEEAALEKALTERPEFLFLRDKTLPEVMREEDWTNLTKALRARGIPPLVASRFQPWYLSIMLAMPPCLREVLAQGPNGLDHRLMTVAEQANVPMASLEPYDTLFTLFTDTPLEDQIDALLLSLLTEDKTDDMLATLQASYFEENHAEAWELSRAEMLNAAEDSTKAQELFAEFEHDLLTGRNEAWIPVILDAVSQHDLITVAAGAAHLGGTQGVLALLEAEGFVLERLPF